ncbi:hypothetical protein Kpho02_66100 [Kitasatospora phosalacinea]|uniref:Uncharacterized protein n=1 Tax=Kitasatospora phosalacinea TaxID=2065 RepID=A0A9W6V6J4_9ACTN|nr:hypothetical protein [Kitasatospora phosalacinea]GLW74312.1 hypothetical protein Kpho02_66100 [Kitasatospora phosalacinea]
MSTHDAPPAARLLMGLYPRRYRAAHGQDIAAVLAETTEGLNRREVLREHVDLAAHALRLRLRIGPTDPAGRLLAGAAPLALAVAAGRALAFLPAQSYEAVHRIRYPFPGLGLGHAVLAAVLLLADSLPWLLALAFALAGRWRAARTTGVLAALTGVGLQLLEPMDTLWRVYCTAVPAIVGALLLLAPTGLVDTTARGRRESAALALGIAVPMIAVLHYGIPLLGPLLLSDASTLTLWQCTVAAVLLLLRLSGRRPDGLRAAGVLLAILPWLTNLALAAADSSQRLSVVALYGGACLAPSAVAATLAAAVHVGRRARTNAPSRPA